MSPLMDRLTALQRRLALQLWARYTAEALLGASILACVWLLVTRLFPLMGDALLATFVLWTAALIYAGVRAWRHRPGLDAAALAADARLGLRERFTSSLALSAVEGPMIEAVHRDAERHASRVNLRQDFPWQPTRAMRWLAVPLLIFGIGYVALPEFDLFSQKERMLEARAKQKELALKAEKLTATAKTLKPREDLGRGEELDAVAAELAELARQLERQEITEKQALARVSNLNTELQERRKALEEKGATPKLSGTPEDSSLAQSIAKDMEEGNPGEAAKKLEDLQKKLAEGGLSQEEQKQLTKDLQSLAAKLGGANSELGKEMAASLAAAQAAMQSGDMQSAAQAMQRMQMSLSDMASAMQQMAMLDSAMQQLGEWQQTAMGSSAFCRNCGRALEPCPNGGNCPSGTCPTGACDGRCPGGCSGQGQGQGGQGLGMGGPGQGRGNRVGDLPDTNTAFKPTVLPGEMTQGKLLADIMQKSLPESGEESHVEFVEGAFVSVQQEAESALTKEEIPPGAKEFVRQYFGAIAPEQDGAGEQ